MVPALVLIPVLVLVELGGGARGNRGKSMARFPKLLGCWAVGVRVGVGWGSTLMIS